MISSFLTAYLLCKKNRLSTDNLFIIYAYVISFGFIGAKLLYVIVRFSYIDFKYVFESMEHFMEFLSAGFVFYGGLIAGFLSLFLVQKIHSIKIKDYINILTISLSIAHSFGRIGCLMTGCCYGKETAGPLYIIYGNYSAAPSGIRLIPVQAFEAALIAILFLILLIIFLKNRDFTNWPLYFISYSVIRFILEFFRGDVERGKFGFLSTSQIISILILTGIIIYLLVRKTSARKNSDS